MAGEPTESYPEFREANAQDAIDNTHVDLVGSSDVEFLSATVGPILRSANGKRWQILVNNNGLYTATEVT